MKETIQKILEEMLSGRIIEFPNTDMLLKTKDEKIANLTAALDDTSHHILRLNQQIANKDMEIEQLNTQIGLMQKTINNNGDMFSKMCTENLGLRKKQTILEDVIYNNAQEITVIERLSGEYKNRAEIAKRALALAISNHDALPNCKANTSECHDCLVCYHDEFKKQATKEIAGEKK